MSFISFISSSTVQVISIIHHVPNATSVSGQLLLQLHPSIMTCCMAVNVFQVDKVQRDLPSLALFQFTDDAEHRHRGDSPADRSMSQFQQYGRSFLPPNLCDPNQAGA
jgi:hypothetical protein